MKKHLIALQKRKNRKIKIKHIMSEKKHLVKAE